MLDLFWFTFFSVLTAVMLGCGFFILCLILERFVLVTVPVIADLWYRIKYPYDYQKDAKYNSDE